MSLDKIEHVVLLMLENRSFDSMLGWLYEHDSPSMNIPPAGAGDAYRGLQSVDLAKFENKALGGKLAVKPIRGAQGFTVPTVAPGEEFDHVNQQFFGTKSPKDGQPVTMTGVVADFVEILKKRGQGADAERLAKQVMETYTPAQLPVLSQLARHYAVSDAWYASVPSQTNPNRAFLLCGTSNGMVDNGFLEDDPKTGHLAKAVEKALGMKIGDDRIDAPTIFNALAAANKEWAVFWQTGYLPKRMATLIEDVDFILAVLKADPSGVGRAVGEAIELLKALEGLKPEELEYVRGLSSGDLGSSYTWRLFPQIRREIADAAKHFQSLDDFHTRARAGILPAFSYIEPSWSISHTTTDNSVKEGILSALGNDYHPPSNLLVGEEFVEDVYTSLISNTDAWRKTLLLITFDEFVGSFDHVTDHLGAGAVAPPWGSGQAPKCEEGFKFDRLGGRVPTILVSPYTQKGTVFRSTTQVPYDHTSVIATTMKWIGRAADTSKFGARAANAPTFEDVLTLSEARTDEATLPFLDTERKVGDPLRYGDSIWLQNQNGDFLSSARTTLKWGPVTDTAEVLADIGVAASFPRCGSGPTVAVALVSHSPDPGPQVGDGDTVRLVSREQRLGSRNVLGAWADSTACYYYDEYVDGENAAKQAWTIQKVGGSGKGVSFGDRVHLVSASSAYRGQGLTRDTSLSQDKWLTTKPSKAADSWTIVPAQPRVGEDTRHWQQAPRVGRALLPLCASPLGGSHGLVLWLLDRNGSLHSTYQDRPGGAWLPWTPPASFPGKSMALVTAALHNHSEVVSVWALAGTPRLQLWSTYQTSPGGNWRPWSRSPDAPVGQAFAACREGGSGSARLWSVDLNFKLHCNHIAATGGWVGWSAPGWNAAPDDVRNVAALLQSDQTIRVWISDAQATVYTAVQKTPGGDDWTAWSTIGAFETFVSLAACQTNDGGSLLLALTRRGVLHATQQSAPGAAWTPWDPPAEQHRKPGWQGANWLSAVTAAHQPGGETGIWVADTAGALRHKAETGGGWGEWSPPF